MYVLFFTILIIDVGNLDTLWFNNNKVSNDFGITGNITISLYEQLINSICGGSAGKVVNLLLEQLIYFNPNGKRSGSDSNLFCITCNFLSDAGNLSIHFKSPGKTINNSSIESGNDCIV